MEDQVEVIKSNKGGMKVIHKGYMYTVHKKRQCGGIRWRCAQRSLHCKGSISTGNDGPPKINMPHNHLPDLHSVAVARGRQAEDLGSFTHLVDVKFEDDPDSMPLQERLSKAAAQEKTNSNQTLKSQPLSPTKLKVTRQSSKSLPPVKPVEPPQSPVNEEMCLRWNSHHSNMQTAFPSILLKEQYVDVTLAAEGKTLKCHRLILSSCSPYFEEILSGISPFQHPVLFMRDIPFWILKSLCDFMYAGEVHIFQNKLEELLTVAEALKIKGLAGKSTPPENQEETNKNDAKEKKKHQPQQHQPPPPPPPPLKKNPVFTPSNNFESTSQDYDNEDLLDPLDLLEPLYEEAAEEKKPSTIVKAKDNRYQYQPIKKSFTKKLRKRKYSEHRDPSPPPVFSFRKGTRSRPNVKIPKYYHSDYSNLPKPTANSQTDPLLDVDEIKTEPIDVEDNLIDYSDEENQYMENSIEPTNCESPIIITSAKPQLPVQDKFKKIRLSKPIITEVHTIEETKTTAGGLEVIKITVQQPEVIDNDKFDNNQSIVTATTTTEDVHTTTITINTAPPEILEQEQPTEPPPEEGTLETETVEEETEISSPNNNKEPVVDEIANNNRISEENAEETNEERNDEKSEEERRTTSLDHLEKEAMNVANAINMETQAGPPDIE